MLPRYIVLYLYSINYSFFLAELNILNMGFCASNGRLSDAGVALSLLQLQPLDYLSVSDVDVRAQIV